MAGTGCDPMGLGIRGGFDQQSLRTRIGVIVCVFSGIVLCVFLLGELRSEVLAGVRAYVGGEGLWSKYEKNAVRSLIAYAHTRADSDYQEYLASIAVPLGDKKARLELENRQFDREAVARGFIEGRNSSSD